jgi:hypothetical protein
MTGTSFPEIWGFRAASTAFPLDHLFAEADAASQTFIARCRMLEAALLKRPSPNPAPAKPRRQRKPRLAPPDGLRTAEQAAARLGCSVKTLAGHVSTGAIGYVITGHGSKRPRRMFTDADLNAFIAAQTRKDAPCPLPASRARHTGISNSRCEVIDFAAPRKPPTGAKRKK